MAETVIYDPSSNRGGDSSWAGGLGGWGGGILGFFLGLLFGNGWGGFGNGFGGFGGGAGAGFLSNQINNDSGRELLMNAITSQGEAARAATQNLATMLGQDFNLVNGTIQTIQSGLSTLALQQAVSVPQIINSIQSGNSALASQLCECCCNMKQLVTSQGYENQLRTVEQTNTLAGAIADLKSTMIDQFCQTEKREMQATIARQGDIITQLRNEADNARQTSAIGAMIAPLAREVDDIKCKLPNTVSVTYPNLYAVNATPYVSGGYYQGGFNGLYGAPGIGGFGGITF